MWHVFASAQIARGRAWKQAHSLLRSHGVSFQLHVSDSTSEHDNLVGAAVESGATHFVAAGGDGAMQLLVNALMERDWNAAPIVASLPLGSGCDFMRSFGRSLNAASIVKLLGQQAPKSRAIDLGVAIGEWGTRYFVNVASIGLTAAVVRQARRVAWLGALRYLTTFWLVLPTYRQRGFKILLGEKEQHSHSILVAVANGRFFGGGFQVAPAAELDDSLLELLIAAATRIQMVSVLYRLWRGTHLRSSHVSSHQLPECTVVCNTPTEVEADGEYLGMTPVEFRLLPKAIQFVCPMKA